MISQPSEVGAPKSGSEPNLQKFPKIPFLSYHVAYSIARCHLPFAQPHGASHGKVSLIPPHGTSHSKVSFSPPHGKVSLALPHGASHGKVSLIPSYGALHGKVSLVPPHGAWYCKVSTT